MIATVHAITKPNKPIELSAKEVTKLYATWLESETYCHDFSGKFVTALKAKGDQELSSDYFKARFEKWSSTEGIRVAPNDYRNFMDYLPERLMTMLPQIFGSGMKPTEEKFFNTSAGITLSNTFIPFNPAIEGDFAMPEILEEYLSKRVFMNAQDRKHITELMADVIQNPLRRPQWAVVVTGDPGTGKSTLYTILKLALGGNHCDDPDEYTSAFKEFSEVLPNNLVLCFDDADNNSRGAYAKLKPAITCSSQSVAIKGQQKPVNRAVYTRIFVCSNKPAPLKIEAGDRRLYCAERSTHRISKEESDEFFEGFIDWLSEPTTPATLYQWLKSIGNPPTKKRSSKVEFSRNEMRRFCNEEVTIHRQPDHGGIEASRGRYAGSGSVPRALHQQRHVL